MTNNPSSKLQPLSTAAPTALIRLGLVAPPDLARLRQPVVHASDKREQLAPILHCSPRTFAVWATEDSAPRGVHLLTLLYLINTAGIDVTEYPLGNVTDTIWKLRELLVFGVVTAEQLAKEAEYAQSQSILAAAFVRQGIMPERQRVLDRVLGDYEKQLTAERTRIEAAIKAICPNAQFRGEPKSVTATTVTIAVSTDISKPLSDGEFALIGPRMMELLPLVQRLANDSTDRGVQLRRKLREQTPSPPTGGVFKLSTALIGLCGEKARGGK